MAKEKWRAWVADEALARLRGWARDGLTDEEIAKNVGVSRSTLSEWKLKHPEIAEALRLGKDAADRTVEESLYQRALGYTVQVRKHYKVRKVEYDETTGRKCAEYEDLVEVLEDEHIPADVRAQIFWLANRKPLEWQPSGQAPERGDEDEDGGTGVVELPQIMGFTPPELEDDQTEAESHAG
jgi:transcriptional regulator with XRE-family HTH domain